MLHVTENAPATTSVVGIDPGTKMLGVCILEFDLVTFEILKIQAVTYDGSRLPSSEWVGYLHGDRVRRISALRDKLTEVLCTYRPLYVCCESPFYNQKRPSAYGALTEIVCAIREAVRAYDMWKPLYMIDPPSVKKAVNASGNAGKDDVKSSISKIETLSRVCVTPIAKLDEHSIDAMAVAYAQYVACRESRLKMFE